MFLVFEMKGKGGTDVPSTQNTALWAMFWCSRQRGHVRHQKHALVERVSGVQDKGEVLKICHIGHVFGVWRMEETTKEAEHRI